MIKLINNEFIKIRKNKIILIELLFLIVILIIDKTAKGDILSTSLKLIPFVGIVVIIIFGGIISNEIENGTIRFYLTKPVNRWKIYLSKLISIYIFLIIILTYILLIYLLIGCKIDKLFVIKYIKFSVPLFLMSTLICLLSAIIRNTSICVGFSIFLLTFSSIFSQILFGLNINFIEYTFLPYLDFTIYDDSVALMEMNRELGLHLSINNGVVIDLIYIVIIYIIGNFIFIKKDIKN